MVMAFRFDLTEQNNIWLIGVTPYKSNDPVQLDI